MSDDDDDDEDDCSPMELLRNALRVHLRICLGLDRIN